MAMLAILTIFFINASSTPGATEPKGATGPAQSFSLEAGKTVNLHSINFVGNKEVSTSQLENLVKPFLNKPFSEADLFELKQRVVLLYKSKGYTNVEVTVPAKHDKHSLTVLIKEGKKAK